MRSFGFCGLPFHRYEPVVSRCRPQRAREKVVLPAPLWPATAMLSPGAACREMSLRTGCFLKDDDAFLSSSTGGCFGAAAHNGFSSYRSIARSPIFCRFSVDSAVNCSGVKSPAILPFSRCVDAACGLHICFYEMVALCGAAWCRSVGLPCRSGELPKEK